MTELPDLDVAIRPDGTPGRPLVVLPLDPWRDAGAAQVAPGQRSVVVGDLEEFGRATDLVAAYLVRLARAPWRVLDRISGRVTARVHGACIGAGTEMAAFAGRVVAAPDAFFALPEVGMGLVPGAGGSVGVPRRIGRWRAGWLMLTGERLPARDALRWGLADELSQPAAGRTGTDQESAPR